LEAAAVAALLLGSLPGVAAATAAAIVQGLPEMLPRAGLSVELLGKVAGVGALVRMILNRMQQKHRRLTA
jgi:hypothetical protein